MSTVHTSGAAGRHPNGATDTVGGWVIRLRSLTFEHWLWVLLTLVALGMRLVGLGDRALSHDESLHALYSWYITDAFNYSHDPMMHGPFLFHVNALLYLLFGASDFTARLFPALVGTATVVSLWWFRGILGRRGALLAAVLLTISPSLLFHSRYIRNDIYVALCSLLWALGLIRYVQTGFQRWLYLLAIQHAGGIGQQGERIHHRGHFRALQPLRCRMGHLADPGCDSACCLSPGGHRGRHGGSGGTVPRTVRPDPGRERTHARGL